MPVASSGGSGGTPTPNAAGMGNPSGGTAGMAGSAAGGSGGVLAFEGKPISVIAYSPYRDGQAPGGDQPSEANVREDLEILRDLVDGVRIYGTDGANAYVPALCDELGLDLYIGAWIDGLESDESNVMALANVVNEDHPSIKMAVVGNEVLHRAADNGMTEAGLIELINLARANITVPTVQIAGADTYPRWMENRPNFADAVDVLIWHTYAWWAGMPIDGAYALVRGRYTDMIELYPGKEMLLGETGWPSDIDRPSMDMTTTAIGDEMSQARYYREILVGLHADALPVWMFSSFDEAWKAAEGEGEVGAHWGIFNTNRTPKLAAMELLAATTP
jgi:exo-beta-1,3-glucanase (GH17 family)